MSATTLQSATIYKPKTKSSLKMPPLRAWMRIKPCQEARECYHEGYWARHAKGAAVN